jgi:hypothetical protein
MRSRLKHSIAALLVLTSYQLSAQLNINWDKHIGSSLSAIGHLVTGITTDEQNNLYTIGTIQGGTDYNSIVNTPSSNFTYTLGFKGNFIAKYSPTGNLLWHKEFHQHGSDNSSWQIDYSNGNLFFTGAMADTLITNDTTYTAYYVSSLSSQFIACVDTASNFQWIKSFSPSNISGNYLASRGNSVYLARSSSYNNSDTLSLTKFSHTGLEQFRYFSVLNPLGSLHSIREINIDNKGNLHIVGEMYNRNFDFDLKPNSTHILTTNTNSSVDGYYFSIDSNCTFRYLVPFQTPGAVAPLNVQSDEFGFQYVNIIGTNGLNLNPLGTSTPYNSSASTNSLLAKYDSTGILISTLYIEGTLFLSGKGIYDDIAIVDSSVFIFGHIYGNPDFDPGVGTLYAPNFAVDHFIAEYDLSFNLINVDFMQLQAPSVYASNNLAFNESSKYFSSPATVFSFNSNSNIYPYTSGHPWKTLLINFSNCSNVIKPVNDTVIVCVGDSINLVVSPSPGYSLRWFGNDSTSIGNSTIPSLLSDSVYSQVFYYSNVDQFNGCVSKKAEIVVTVNALPTAAITASGSTTFCQGDSVVLTASSGSSYQWKLNGTNITGAASATYTALTAGNHSVEVTNASNCSATSTSTSITVNALPTAAITASGSTTFCQGDSVVLTASSGSSYQWKLNGTNITGAASATYTALTAGNHSVEVTNASNCSAVSSIISVDVLSQITSVTIVGQTTSIIPGVSYAYIVTLDPNLSYNWTAQNGAIILGQGSNSVQAMWNSVPTGILLVERSNGHCSYTDTISITTTIGIDESNLEAPIIYPNPTIGKLNVSVNQASYYLYGLNGTLLQNGSIENSLDLGHLPNGTYTLVLEVENRKYVYRVNVVD